VLRRELIERNRIPEAALERSARGGEDPLALLNDPRSVLLTKEYATRRALSIGSAVSFATPSFA
jgi:hypothetical protein